MDFAAEHGSGTGRLCCKSIFGIWSRNIDSRSDTNEQQRFKRTGDPIQLLQISISQSLLGDFCNTIGTNRPNEDVPFTAASGGITDMPRTLGGGRI
jgi:hypothetical protein